MSSRYCTILLGLKTPFWSCQVPFKAIFDCFTSHFRVLPIVHLFAAWSDWLLSSGLRSHREGPGSPVSSCRSTFCAASLSSRAPPATFLFERFSTKPVPLPCQGLPASLQQLSVSAPVGIASVAPRPFVARSEPRKTDSGCTGARFGARRSGGCCEGRCWRSTCLRESRGAAGRRPRDWELEPCSCTRCSDMALLF